MIGRVNTGGGGSGGTLTVTAPAGVTVTVSKDGKTKTKVAGPDGIAVFKGLSSGEWTLTITDGIQTSTKPVVITADYSAVIAFFAATINVTYPAGSTCTATDGTTTLNAPDTSGTWVCVVPNAGTWTVTITDGSDSASTDVSITDNGQSKSVTIVYWNGELYKNGNEYSSVTGGWKTAGSVTKGSTSIVVGAKKSSASADYTAKAYHSNYIDFTNFSKLTVHFVRYYTNASATDGYIYIRNTSGTAVATKEVFSAQTDVSDKTVSIDISNLSGQHRVEFYIADGKSGRYGYEEFDSVLLS